jgi:hypothetical protein
MGASLSWFAVRGKRPELVLQDFGLKSVGKEYRDTPFCGGPLPNGWYLVVHGRHEYTNAEAQRLSRGCEVLACFVEEHVMVSRAAGWKDGKEVWSVTHDAGQDDLHLEIQGDPPDGFTAIRDRLLRQQEEEGGCDFIFNIPVALAAEITGYCHEDSIADVFENFVKRTFFQRIFGG